MYNEPEFIKLIFLLADTQSWIEELSKDAFMQLPVKDKCKLQRKTYFLSVSALAHIIEKHYHAVSRHPQSGKFTIPVADIVQHIKLAADIVPQNISGNLNFYRTAKTASYIGHDRNGNAVNEFTIITDAAGSIVTAFPGVLRNHCML